MGSPHLTLKNQVQLGQVFGLWTVIGPGVTRSHSKVRCACGKEQNVSNYDLINDRTKSCGTKGVHGAAHWSKDPNDWRKEHVRE